MNKENENSNKKRKRVCLSIEQKLKILEQLDAGQIQTLLAEKYNVSQSTISHVIRDRAQIYKRAEYLQREHSNLSKKRCSGIEESACEKIVYSWFVQNRAANIPMCGAALQEIAAQVHLEMDLASNFKASAGWLEKFKQRHGIRELSVQGEKGLNDSNESKEFCMRLQQLIATEGYTPDCIYNADETGLQWKVLPKTLVDRKERCASGRKVTKDRLTIMTCANASGSHRIPLLVIGKVKKPRCFQDIEILPVKYTNQKNAWMDKATFVEWYTNIFLPTIKNKVTESANKFLLILDNAPCHPSTEELNAIDPYCKILYLPPNVTSLIQPMNQGIIVALKQLYKKSYLHECLFMDGEFENRVERITKSWNLINCFEKLAVSWNNLSQSTLKNAWKNILKDTRYIEDPLENEVSYLTNMINEVFQPQVVTEEETIEWLNIDATDGGWPLQSVNELIQSSIHGEHFLSNECNNLESDDDDENAVEYDGTNQPNVPDIVSDDEAIQAASKMYKWIMRRWDCDSNMLICCGQIKGFIEDIAAHNKMTNYTNPS